MKCPLKFSRYEFEGGETCIGAECGFYGAVCRNDDLPPDSDVSAASVDANDGNAAPDSREKLEADVLKFSQVYYANHLLVYDKVIELLDRQKAITERETRLRELYRFEENHRASIDKTEEVNRELNSRIAELQEKVDELTAQLRASNAERERLRECLGIATDNAHDFLTLVDESGNVYDRDEGLA